jgi:acyl-CoA thioesterase
LLANSHKDHPFDAATRVTVENEKAAGQTDDRYWAFVGSFGGITAGTMLRSVVEHHKRSGDPLAITVNYCAPISRGKFDLDVRLIRANRSSQHWSVELSQGGETAAFATVVFAARRSTWSHQPRKMPPVSSFDATPIYGGSSAASWVQQYELRFVDGIPDIGEVASSEPKNASSILWIRDAIPRKVDALSLASICDTFFGRIFHARKVIVPFGTVSLTTYFHVDGEDLANESTDRVLGMADASVFHKNYGDQNGAIWAPSGRLLATTTQSTYFKL